MALLTATFALLLLTTMSACHQDDDDDDDEEDLLPHPSSDLPLVDLVESPDSRYDPRPEDLSPESLLRQLGSDFDSRFMSLGRPPPPRDPAAALYGLTVDGEGVGVGGGGGGGRGGSSNGSVGPSTQFSRRQMALLAGRKKSTAAGGNLLLLPRGKMPTEVKRLRLQPVLLPDGRRLRAGGGDRKLRRTLRQFLWARSFCPVVFAWRDLGPRFWPRWLREGRCQSRRSCSFPAGMSCKPSRASAKTLLRWHCRDWNAAEHCRWIRVKYPLVTACSCSC